MRYFRYISSILICSEEQTIDDQTMQRDTWCLPQSNSSAFAFNNKTQQAVIQMDEVIKVYLITLIGPGVYLINIHQPEENKNKTQTVKQKMRYLSDIRHKNFIFT